MSEKRLFPESIDLSPLRPRPLAQRERAALWSRCSKTASFGGGNREWRYMLTRYWGERGSGAPALMVIGLNPSTADENVEDPTIRRCICYAMDWGYSGLYMGNLFGWRSTDPRALDDCRWPVAHPDSAGLHDAILHSYAARAGLVLAAWGSDRAIGSRGEEVCRIVDKPVYCLGTNADGNPKHPLYLRRDLRPQLYWQPGRGRA